MKGIIGRKIAMTQLFSEKGQAIPVTIIEVLPNVVLQNKTSDQEGYTATKLASVPKRVSLVNRPDLGQFEKAKTKPMRYVREIREMSGFEVGQTLTASDLFQAGDQVDATAVSKGKGFAGVIKRHNFSTGPMAHGSGYHRGIGSMGAMAPKRVFKGKKMAGQMGHQQVTMQNLSIVQIKPENNLVLLKGSVPGPNKCMVILKNTTRSVQHKEPVVLYQNKSAQTSTNLTKEKA